MIRLQFFGHRVSGYDRPNEPWICGWAASGQPCRVGPDRRGRCQATFECQPRRNGDRWECTRPASAGGCCAEGPSPNGTCSHAIPRCMPMRSQRSRRGQITGATFAALLGLLALILGGKSAAWLVEPGPLSVRHGGIQQCSACHTRFADGPIGWLHAAFVAAPAAATARPCLVCHNVGEHPLSAHSLDRSTLTRLGQEVVAAAAPSGDAAAHKLAVPTAAAFTLPAVARRDVACSACHREHRGAAARLTSVHSAICQTCHVSQFDSLADGHPEFADFPFHRRTRIIFDHAKHFDQDFAQSKKALVPAGCTGCHAPDPAGKAMVVKSFATACGACHLGDIKEREGANVQGVAVLGIPALDVATLRAHDAAIGAWPADADGNMTPFLRFLLARRPDTAKDLAALGPLSLGDLSHADNAQIAAAARIAWAIKGLLFDISIKGPAVVAHAAVGEGGGTPAASAALVGGLPPDAITTADKLWLPNLADEVTRHRAGERVPMAAPQPPSKASGAAPPPPPTGGQSAIAGIGNGAILGGGGGLLGAAPPSTAGVNHGSILGGRGILGGTAPAHAPASAPASRPTPPRAAGGQGAIAGTGNGAILGGGGLLGAAPSPAAGGKQGSILGGQGILGGAPPPPPAAPAATPTPARPQPPAPISSEAWTALGGGWYRQDYFLYYRPTAHADPFLRAWLDVTGRQAQDPNGPARRLFERLSNPNAPGACGECHSVDRAPGRTLIVNWLPFRPDPDRHRFTKFSHRPHLQLSGSTGCKTCHRLDAAAPFSATYKSGDPFVFTASFKPIARTLCASCHIAGRASAACTTCHNYHIGVFPQALGASLLPAPAAASALRRIDAGADSHLAVRLRQ
jgi:hypothetical protein